MQSGGEVLLSRFVKPLRLLSWRAGLLLVGWSSLLIGGVGLLMAGDASADNANNASAVAPFPSQHKLQQLIFQFRGQVYAVARLLSMVSYVSGIAITVAGILMFKQHKENQGVHLSKPIILISVGSGLLFLPTVMQVTGASLFGTGAQTDVSITNFKTY